MSTALANLIKAITPNFALKDLRAMVPWFDAVSGNLDAAASIVALGLLDGAGAFQKRFGFATPAVHGGAGNYQLSLSTATYNINELFPFAIASNVGTPGGAINLYPSMLTNVIVEVRAWQIAVTTAARTAVDTEFYVAVLKMPTP